MAIAGKVPGSESFGCHTLCHAISRRETDLAWLGHHVPSELVVGSERLAENNDRNDQAEPRREACRGWTGSRVGGDRR